MQRAELTASDGTAGDELGVALALSENTALVGAKGIGAAYVFVRNGTSWTWSQQAELTSSGNGGVALSAPGILALTGAPSTNNVTGTAYVYDLTDFRQVPGTLISSAVGNASAVWGLTAAQQIYQYNPSTGRFGQVQGNSQVQHALTSTAVGADGRLWGIDPVMIGG